MKRRRPSYVIVSELDGGFRQLFEHVAVVIQLGQRHERRAIGASGSFQDRVVARAAAQIADQRTARLASRRVRGLVEQRTKRHDNAWRAITALNSVLGDDARLRRIQRAVMEQSLNGNDMRAVELGDILDAGCHRAIDDPTLLHSSHQDRARAAVPLGTGDLRAGQAERRAEKLGQRLEDLPATDFMAAPVDIQKDEIPHTHARQTWTAGQRV